MHARHSLPPDLRRLAAHQDGVLTREQVLGSGVSRHVLGRLLAEGAWTTLNPGVYRTVGGPVPWSALAWAGVLLGGPRARLGAQASGHLVGLVQVAPEPVDVLVPVGSTLRRRGPWQFIREQPGLRSSRSVGEPPRLGADDLVLDLVEQADERQAEGVVVEAVRLGLTTPERLARALTRRTRMRHRRLVEGLLADARGIESTLELDYLRLVERAHGLPTGRRQTVDPALPFRRDVEYEPYRVVVELDGRRGHMGRGALRDLDRDNRHLLGGRATLRYGWGDVHGRPCSVAYQVFALLWQRGCVEPYGRCPRCAAVPEDKLCDLAA